MTTPSESDAAVLKRKLLEKKISQEEYDHLSKMRAALEQQPGKAQTFVDEEGQTRRKPRRPS